ncbi:hypothetical protein CEY04_30365 [Achromobacter sp. HZ28]|nr:hypothetical protein CEY04_30365 [Achromobacter sp. HZ28]OWT81030.1 hypothetical protein CEY05_06675 [Achromobacter sp. HZ34]
MRDRWFCRAMRSTNAVALVLTWVFVFATPGLTAEIMLPLVTTWSLAAFLAVHGLRPDASGLSRHGAFWINLLFCVLTGLALTYNIYVLHGKMWPTNAALPFQMLWAVLALPTLIALVLKNGDVQRDLYWMPGAAQGSMPGGQGQRVEPGFADLAMVAAAAEGALPLSPAPGMPSPTPMAAAAPVAAGAARGTQAQADSRKGNYFLRHWRGKFSLPVSYWLNSVLLLALLGAGRFFLIRASEDASLRTRSLLLVIVMVTWTVIWTWSTIGVWRSAERRSRSGGGRGWAAAAKIVSIVAVLGMLSELRLVTVPQITELTMIALGKDPIDEAVVKVSTDGHAIFLGGGLRTGSAERVLEVLDQTPNARFMVLASGGGRLAEAQQIAQAVKARHLDTYVDGSCASACTFIFLAGEHRILTAGAMLGFHQSSGAALDRRVQRAGLRVMLKAYGAAGLPDDFITKIAATPPQSMWYPTERQLIEAKVVTRVSPNTQWDEWSFLRSRRDVADLVAMGPVAKAFERRFPGMSERAADHGWEAVQQGRQRDEIRAAIYTVYTEAFPLLLRSADPAARLRYARWKLNELTALGAVDASTCAAEVDASLSVPAALPAEMKEERMGALMQLLAPPQPASAPTYGLQEAQAVLRNVISRAPGRAAAAAQKPDPARFSPALICSATAGLYRAVLDLPADQRDQALYALMH